jgi:hypothetical protein
VYLGKFDNNSFNTIYAGKVFIPIKTAMTVIPQQSMIINGIGGNSSSSGSGSSSGALFT